MILQFIKSNWIVLVLIIGVLVLLFVLFGGKKNSDQKLNEALIRQMDISNKKEEEKTALYERLIEEKDKNYEILEERDSALIAHYNEKDLQIKRLNETIRNIPARINRLGNNADSIARAFADF